MSSSTLESSAPDLHPDSYSGSQSGSGSGSESDKKSDFQNEIVENFQSQPLEYYKSIFQAGFLLLIKDTYTKSVTSHTIIKNIAENYELEYETVFNIAESVATLLWDFSKNPLNLEELSFQTNWSEDISDIFMKVYTENSWKIEEFKKGFIESPSYYDMSWRLDIEIARRNVREMYLPKYMIRFDFLSKNGRLFSNNSNSSKIINSNSNTSRNGNNNDNINNNNKNNDNNNDNNDSSDNNDKNNNNNNDDNDNNNNNNNSNNSNNNNVITNDIKESLISINVQCDYANLKKMESKIKAALDSLKIINSQTSVEYIS